ncbi:MAG: CinA family nicotinamide mononucleotide deamidase-related protein [Elusimicrobiota bacterium]|nr:CinA family nicotinamide mononucleotide deamidase-related protein [Elusimicrobiota bacterium]
MVKCSIINVGSELLKGRGAGSGRQAAKLLSWAGFTIQSILTVGDDRDRLKKVLDRLLKEELALILVIGGMGSAPDNITAGAVSKVLGRKLKFSRQAMENVAAYFAGRGMDVPDEADSQADILEGAVVLKNRKGSSPGQLVELEKDRDLLLLPGPPDEVRYLVEKKVIPYINKKYPSLISKKKVIRIAGLCENEVQKTLIGVLQTERNLEESHLDFTFESCGGTVDLFLSISGRDEILVDEILHKLVQEIEEEVGENIYGYDNETLEGAAGKLLAKKRADLAVAESCTGGLLSSKITDAQGSSVYFKYGVVAYSVSAKKSQLNIEGEIIKAKGAVSEEVAAAMAENIKNIASSTYGIAVTGYAGPSGGKKEKAGTGFIALASDGGTRTEKKIFTGNRKEIKEYFARAALELLWRELKKE